jgi:hypothetical protein
MRADISHDLGTLLFISKASFKNRIKAILDNPFKTIISVIKWVFYFALVFSPLIIAFVSRSSKKTSSFNNNIDFAKPYIGGVLLILILFYVFYTLKKAVDDYKPTIFKAPDANLLFASPLNRRTVYLYAIMRAMVSNLMTAISLVCFFLIITISFRITLIPWAVPLAIIGLFSFGVFMQSFKFFINSLNKKLKSDKYSSFVFYLLLLAVIGCVLYKVSAVNHDIPSIISAFGSPSLEFIPFAGWTKGIVLGLVFPNPNIILFAALYFVCAAASFVLSVFWADNYYEDTITSLGETTEIVEATKKGRTDELLARSYRGKKQIKTDISISGTGAKSFLWKSLLIYKKNFISKPLSSLTGYLFFLIIGIALVLFTKESFESNFLLMVIIFSSSSVTANMSGINAELKHSYLFITPGKLRYKLFYTVIQPIIQFAIQFLLGFIPLLIAGKLNFAEFLFAYLAAVTMGALPISGGVIVTSIFPDDEALRKNPFMAMLKGFFILLYYIPGAIICGLSVLIIYLTTHAFTSWIAYLGFAVGNVITVFLMFIISESIFKRIEYKQ